MRFLTALFVISTLGDVPIPSLANPVDKGTVDRLNAFPGKLVSSQGADEKEEFTQLLGRYGFDLMDKKSIKQIQGHFDQFAPLLIQSQSPGYRIDRKLQDFFWENADIHQQESMIKSLQTWLDAPLTEAPRHGGVQITGPEGEVRELILRERITAAQTLWEHRRSLGLSMVDAILDSCASRRWSEMDPCGDLIAWTFQNPGSSTHSQGTAFTEEEVRLTITATRLEVEGVYVFSRGDSATTSLWFPFPENSYTDPNSVEVTDLRTESKAPWSWGGHGIVVRLDFGGGEMARVRIRYAERLYEEKAVYILKTAMLWPKPLGKAHLQVNLPASYRPAFSLPFARTREIDGVATYEFSATEFQPSQDLVVNW
jgi:hypothetical protein